MSISLIVSPLCRILHINMKDVPRSADVPSPVPGVGVRVMPWQEVEKHLHTYPKADVLRWRNALSQKYQSQLAAPLTWDEDTSFEESEDLTGGELVMLGHTAACIDLLGETEAAHRLAGQADIPMSEQVEFSQKAEAKGYRSKFPQLLLGVDCWLPFQRDMIIEEPDAHGTVGRFGSLFALKREIDAIRAFVQNAEPTAASPDRLRPQLKATVLQRAWGCTIPMQRLTADAIAHRIPMTLSQ